MSTCSSVPLEYFALFSPLNPIHSWRLNTYSVRGSGPSKDYDRGKLNLWYSFYYWATIILHPLLKTLGKGRGSEFRQDIETSPPHLLVSDLEPVSSHLNPRSLFFKWLVTRIECDKAPCRIPGTEWRLGTWEFASTFHWVPSIIVRWVFCLFFVFTILPIFKCIVQWN